MRRVPAPAVHFLAPGRAFPGLPEASALRRAGGTGALRPATVFIAPAVVPGAAQVDRVVHTGASVLLVEAVAVFLLAGAPFPFAVDACRGVAGGSVGIERRIIAASLLAVASRPRAIIARIISSCGA